MLKSKILEKMPIQMIRKRTKEEWHDAILSIIKSRGGVANYNDLYSEIPQILQLNERELRPSGKAKELTWRGTLRGYLSKMV